MILIVNFLSYDIVYVPLQTIITSD